jgi:hypothetical protein
MEKVENYRKHIQDILNQKVTDVSDPKIGFIGFMSSKIEQILITFLAREHNSGEKCVMSTRSREIVNITLNLESGAIFKMNRSDDDVIAIYVGEHNRKSYFYIPGDSGLSYWNTITYESLKFERRLEIDLLLNTHEPKIDFKIENRMRQLYDCFSSFHDVKIICLDGEIGSNRFLLSQSSKYFFVYFSKYTTDVIHLDFPKMMVETYHRYLMLKETPSFLNESLTSWIEFSDFIDDIEFMKFIYEHVWEDLNNDEKSELNQCVKSLFSKSFRGNYT